jgi:hypothetical protein
VITFGGLGVLDTSMKEDIWPALRCFIFAQGVVVAEKMLVKG